MRANPPRSSLHHRKRRAKTVARSSYGLDFLRLSPADLINPTVALRRVSRGARSDRNPRAIAPRLRCAAISPSPYLLTSNRPFQEATTI